MKKTNKKGFTIVELVIVIAVIAILAGVMIPTFSGIITTANESAEAQNAANAYKEAYAEAITDDGSIEGDTLSAKIGDVTYSFTMTDANNGTATGKTGYTYTCTAGKWTAEKAD